MRATTERGTAFGRDWTKGSIVKNLLQLSWPMIISQSLNMSGPTIDMIWVGKLGAAPIAGVGVAGMIVMFMTSMTMGLAMGARAMIARFIGAGDARGANHAARQSFAISAFFAIVVVTVGISFADKILVLMGVEADVVVEGTAYMRIMFFGAAFMGFRMMAEGIMQASGDAMTPMKISVLFRAIHVAICPFMVLGWWIFPQLGVSGAALTNVFSQGIGLTLALWVLYSGRTRLRLTLSGFRLDPGMMWRIVRIGLPAAVMAMQRGLGQLILMRFMVPFGTLAVAAHTLGQRIEMVIIMTGMGFGLGGGVMVGQNLGAGHPERAERSGWLAAGFVEGLMVICSLAILLWAEHIVSLFNTEPALVELASAFMRIAAAGFFVVGLVVVLMNCLVGAGDTIPPMFFEMAPMWGVMLPLAYFLPQVTDLGVYGVRWAIVANMWVGAIVYTTYFTLGRWKHKKV